MLPPNLKEKSVRLARQLGMSFGEFVRTAIDQAVSQSRGSSKTFKDSLMADHEVFQGSVPKDLSTHHDQYLYGES